MAQFVKDYSCPNGSIHLMQVENEEKIANVLKDEMMRIGPRNNNIHITSRGFYDVRTWQRTVQDLDLVIGPRIHGSMIPLSVEVPTVTIKIDARVGELCDAMDLACCMPGRNGGGRGGKDDFKERILSAMKEFDGDKFDSNRKSKAAMYHKMFQELGLTLNKGVAALAQT